MPDISQINIPNNDGSMTYNIKDANVPHSSLPAVSGGTDLSLVTTGEKADWIDKTKIYQVECTLGSSRGMWNCNLDLPVLYDGLLLLCKCPSDTYNNGGTISLYVTLSDGTVVDNIVIGGNLSNVSFGEYYLFRYSVSDIVTTWDWVGALAYGGRYVSQQPRNTSYISLSYPLLFSDTATDSTSGYMYTATAYTYRLYYDPYNANLVTPKINNYTLAPACEKQVDTEVEQSSDNLPTSDAVYNAVNAIHIQTKTASGEIATFNDAAGDVPFATLKSDINPVQDLHGYSKPWSGGGGKNKLNCTATTRTTNGVTLTVVKNSANQVVQINVSGTATAGFSFTLGTATIEAGTYVFNGYSGGSSVGTKYINYSGIVNAYGSNVTSTISETKTTTASLQIASGAETGLTIYPMIRLSNTSADFEPYSNICPISGFNALNVTRTGVNLWDEQWELGTLSADGQPSSSNINIRSKNFIKVMPLATLFIKSPYTAGIGVYQYDSNHNYLTRGFIANNTITLNSNTHYLKFRTPDNVTTYGNDISINYPSSDTEYHAYNGQTATVNFGQTVYGGVADVTNGKVTITHKLLTFDGSEAWSTRSSAVGTLYELNTDQEIKANSGVSNLYTYEQNLTANGSFRILVSGVNNLIAIHDDNRTDLATFKTYLSNNNLKILGELATPIEVDITAENLTAISGENNVYSDTNGDTEVEYFSGDCDGIIKLLKALSVI